jgi:hypothetical protein
MKIIKVEDNSFVFKARIELDKYFEQFKEKFDNEHDFIRDAIVNTIIFYGMSPKFDIAKEAIHFVFSEPEKCCHIEIKNTRMDDATKQQSLFVLAKITDGRVGFIINVSDKQDGKTTTY